MKIRFLVWGMAIMLIVFGIQSVEAGIFDKLTGKSSGGSVSRSDIDAVYTLVLDAEALLKKSVDIAFKLLASKEELEKIEQRQKQIDEIKDPKEKEAEMKKVQEDKMAATQKMIEKEETSKKAAALDAQQKVLFGKSIYNLILAGLKDKDAVVKAKDVSQKIQGNPSSATNFASDVNKLKDIVTTVPSQAEKIGTLGNNLSKFASKNNIEVAMPQSAADKPKEVEI